MTNKLYWLEINKKNIAYNIGNIKSILDPKTRLMVVVKSNAYGHGLVPFAKQAVFNGAEYLGVANIEEALILRQEKIIKPIMVLGYVPIERIPEAAANYIDIPIISPDYAVALIRQKFLGKLKVHFKVDTGLNRMGISPAGILNIFKELNKYKKIEIVGLYTHLAAVEESNMDYTAGQFKMFGEVIRNLAKNNIEIPIKHVAASSAAFIFPESHFDMVRMGIAGYGLWPSEENRKSFFADAPPDIPKPFLRPILSYKTRVVEIKEVKSGYIGYGASFRITKPMRIAILPVGYFEGIARGLSCSSKKSKDSSGCGEVLISGIRCPIVGRICMNMTVVDVSKIPARNLRLLDEAVIIGRDGQEEITVEEIAAKLNTINYEITTRIPEHIERIYINE